MNIQKGKCVKSIRGEFSSGVSICRNKGTQSDLGTPSFPDPPPAGYGLLPPAQAMTQRIRTLPGLDQLRN